MKKNYHKTLIACYLGFITLQISAPSFEKAEAEKFLPFPPSAFCDFLFLFIVHAVVRSLFGDVDIMRMGLF